jgi:hypothetical protein
VTPAHRVTFSDLTRSLDWTSSWHPAVATLYDHWHALIVERGGSLPSAQTIARDGLPPAVGPWCWLVAWQPDPARLRYTSIGAKIVAMLGADHTGSWLDEIHPELALDETHLDRHRTVASTHIPNWRKGPALLHYERAAFVESITMPLATDGARVDAFLLQSRFYAADATEL